MPAQYLDLGHLVPATCCNAKTIQAILRSEGSSLVDRLSPEQRSRNMAQIRGRNTEPELVVRHLLHGLGYRYRLHVAGLPGRPDIVFPPRRKVILLHGCFWHRHAGCKYAYMPKSRVDFWRQKFEQNVARDARMRKTQVRVARKMKVGQDSVSRVEKRADMLISTLRGYVKAMGGELDLVASFPDRPPVRLKDLGEIAAKPPSRKKRAIA
jgi:DNA mismatch endonuclease, patch repair protein